MPTKNKFISLAMVMIILILVGCTPLEDIIIDEMPDYAKASVNGPMTEMDYTNKVTSIIMPFMNEGETFLAHHLEIVRGNFPIQQEIALVEASIGRAQQAIEEIDNLYQPTSYTEHKVETITRLNEYKDALIRYKNALEGGKKDDIKKAADYIKSILASLKTAHALY
jgi:hypothetical protein